MALASDWFGPTRGHPECARRRTHQDDEGAGAKAVTDAADPNSRIPCGACRQLAAAHPRSRANRSGLLERPVVGVEPIGLQHGDPAGRLALGLGGWFVLAVGVVVRLRVSQTLGDVMLYIRVVFGRARL